MPPAGVRVNVDAVSEAGSMASLNDTCTVVEVMISIAPARGARSVT